MCKKPISKGDTRNPNALGTLRTPTITSSFTTISFGDMNRVHILQKVLERGMVRETSNWPQLNHLEMDRSPSRFQDSAEGQSLRTGNFLENKAFGIQTFSASQTSYYLIPTPPNSAITVSMVTDREIAACQMAFVVPFPACFSV